MTEATTRRPLLALTAVMAALLCAPASVPAEVLDPSKTAPRDFWVPEPERVTLKLVRIPGSQRFDLAITTATAPGRPKWLSRDPLGEAGGLNLYGFVENDPINNYDYLGLITGREALAGSRDVRIPVYGADGELVRVWTDAEIVDFLSTLPGPVRDAWLDIDWGDGFGGFDFFTNTAQIASGVTPNLVRSYERKLADAALAAEYEKTGRAKFSRFLRNTTGVTKGVMDGVGVGTVLGVAKRETIIADGLAGVSINGAETSEVLAAMWNTERGKYELAGNLLGAVLAGAKGAPGRGRAPAANPRSVIDAAQIAAQVETMGATLSATARQFLNQLAARYRSVPGVVNMADDFWQQGNRVVLLDRLQAPPTKPFADPEKLLRHGTFDKSKYTPIVVDELPDGTLVIMEGMTRVENARRSGMTQLPAFVYPRR